MNTKWPKCPKCRSRDVELVEHWTAYISWSPDEPYFQEGSLLPGDPTHVEGKCLNCKHYWRIRRVSQVQEEWFEET